MAFNRKPVLKSVLMHKIKPLAGPLKLKSLFPLFALVFTGSACYFNPKGAGSALTLPSVGESFSISDSEFMYVDLDKASYERQSEEVPFYEMSTTEHFGESAERNSVSNCEIEHTPSDDDDEGPSTTRRAAPPLICVLDMPEWDFAVKDFHIIYNFPEGMCEYVSVALPWHFNHPVKQGPVVRECSLPGEESGTGYCDALAGSDTSCSTRRCVEDEENVCPGKPKCCYGGEKTDGTEWVPEKDCFGGPGLVVTSANFQDFTKEHISPLPEGGVKQSLSMRNLIALNGAESINGSSVSAPYTNYLKALDKSPDDLQINRSNLPAFLQESSYLFLPRLFFEFTCKDGAGEDLHKILLMVREWNTLEEFIRFHDAGGSNDADPDVEGLEGTDCDYEEMGSFERGENQCNDLLDLDDIANCNSSFHPFWCECFAGQGAERCRTNSGSASGMYPRISYTQRSGSSTGSN